MGTVVTVVLPLDVFDGLQDEEPVAAGHPIETTFAADAVVGEARLDEPIGDEALATVPALVGALLSGPPSEAVVAAESDLSMPAIALFDPSEVSLSRLPQVDVAALVADAEADSRSHAIAAPVAPESGGRRLLPRRSRSDEAAVPADSAPVDPVSVAEVPDIEVPVDVVDDQSAWQDSEQPEIASHARRRGSFFARRRETPPLESIETHGTPETAVEPALVTDEHVEPQADEEPAAAAIEFPTAAPEPTLDEPVLESPVEQVGVDEPVVVVATDEPVARRGLFGRRQWIADAPLVVAQALIRGCFLNLPPPKAVKVVAS